MKAIKIGILLVGLSFCSYSNLYCQLKDATESMVEVEGFIRRNAGKFSGQKRLDTQKTNYQSNTNNNNNNKNNAPVLSIEDMGGYDMTSEGNILDMPSARESNKLGLDDLLNTQTESLGINTDNLDAYFSKEKNGVTIGDISGKSLIDGQLENQPSLATPDYSGLAESEAEMKKRMEDALVAKRKNLQEIDRDKLTDSQKNIYDTQKQENEKLKSEGELNVFSGQDKQKMGQEMKSDNARFAGAVHTIRGMNQEKKGKQQIKQAEENQKKLDAAAQKAIENNKKKK